MRDDDDDDDDDDKPLDGLEISRIVCRLECVRLCRGLAARCGEERVQMSRTEIWLTLAGVLFPSLVVVFFAWLNHRNAARNAAESKRRDDDLGNRITEVGSRLEGRIERVDDRIEGLRKDVTTFAVTAAYAAGRQHGAAEAGPSQQRGGAPRPAPDSDPGPDPPH